MINNSADGFWISRFFSVLCGLVVVVFIIYPADLWIKSGFHFLKYGWNGRPFIFVSDSSALVYVGASCLIEIVCVWLYLLTKRRVFIAYGIFSGLALGLYLFGFLTWCFDFL